MKRLVVALVLVAIAWQGVAPVAAETTPSTPLAECEDAALAGDYSSWVCLGGNLTGVDASTGVLESKTVAPSQVGEPVTRARLGVSSLSSSTFDSDFDGWCELGTICTRRITMYISETKGNAAWGDQSGVRGTFDVALRTNLNGRSARWTVYLTVDSGPNILINEQWVNCYEDLNYWLDNNCGQHRVKAQGGVTSWTINYSVFKSPLLYGNRLENSNKYYGQTSGRFTPSGFQTLVMSPLKSAEFECWGTGNCVFP